VNTWFGSPSPDHVAGWRCGGRRRDDAERSGGRRREIPEDHFARRGTGFVEKRHPHIDAAVDAYRPAAPGSEEEDRILGIARHVMLLSRPGARQVIRFDSYSSIPHIRGFAEKETHRLENRQLREEK